jgi:regulator of RNase E activity RraA
MAHIYDKNIFKDDLKSFDYGDIKKYSVEENKALIEKFKRLRVTDIRDGMDWVGYHHYGTLEPSFRPLDGSLTKEGAVIGIAKTARFVPYEGPEPVETYEEYTAWAKMYYAKICYNPWSKEIQPGDFCCLDIAGIDVGLMGSNNTLAYMNKGVVGFLLNGGGIRDTNECITEKIPVWSRHISQPMNQGRIRYIAQDIPVGIGGVAIYPGDVVAADNDGVIVVPRKVALDVAKYAWQEANADKKTRKQLYIDAGLPLDKTVE